MSNFNQESVLSVHHWTDTLFSFTTTRDPSFRFRNGEFTMIGLKVGEKPLLRAYSVASANYEDRLEFFSIKVPDGPLTSRLQHLKQGDEIIVSRKATGTLVIDNLEDGRNLYLVGTGTGLAPFLSVIKDPETYERFEKIVLLHGCRRVKELAYGEMITEKLPNDELIGELVHNQLIYYPTVTRVKFDQFRRAVIIGLRPDAGDAASQSPLQRAERLPFQPVDRIVRRMGLRDRRTRQMLVPIIVMAIAAGKIELALAPHEEIAPLGDERRERGVGTGLNRHPARLLRDERGEREQVVAFVRERRGLLVIGAAKIDALLEIDRATERLVVGGIAGGDALHAGAGIVVAIGTGVVGGAGLALPQCLAIEHPEHAGIGGVVVLHGLRVGGHEGKPRTALIARDFGGERHHREQNDGDCDGGGKSHSTDIEADAFSAKPLSPIHSNSNLPLAVAVVKKLMNGLAEIAGNRSTRKISAPLKRQTKLVMMSRGTASPEAVWR
jgi:ferredoxin--NADP+ reductase